LPEIALVINTTYSTALPRGETPYIVYFSSRQPHWLTYEPISESEESDDEASNDDDEDEHIPTDTEDYVLTEIESRIAKNNLKVHARIAGKGKPDIAIFDKGKVVTLAIPKKLRLTSELQRLPVRVIKYSKGQYTLLSRHGQLSKSYSGGDLNPVYDEATATLSEGIPRVPPKKGRKPVQITLAKAVSLENNRGSVAAAQKAGRKEKGKKRAVDDVEVEAEDNGEGPISPSAGPSTRASKRARSS